jgi:hypothetical protein
VRVAGWCQSCQGAGRLSFTHVDAPADEAVLRAVLELVAQRISAAVAARAVELGDGHGCEAAAARRFEDGRRSVIEVDMWLAVGLAPP